MATHFLRAEFSVSLSGNMNGKKSESRTRFGSSNATILSPSVKLMDFCNSV